MIWHIVGKVLRGRSGAVALKFLGVLLLVVGALLLGREEAAKLCESFLNSPLPELPLIP